MDGLDPVAYPEIDALCRLSKNIIIRCDACGMSNGPGEAAHLCCCAFGWYCSDACCPVCNGSLTYTLAEFRQIVVNRENQGGTKLYWSEKRAPWIIRIDPSRAPRSGQWAEAFQILEDGMPYLVALDLLAGRFLNPKMLWANLRRRGAIRRSQG